MTKQFSHSFIMLLSVLLTSCSALKFIPKDEQLYTGAEVIIGKNNQEKYTKKAKKIAKESFRPAPNSSYLGMRPALWLYYKTVKYESGWKHWVNKKFSDQPVYKSMVDPEMVSTAIDARLYNLGYFDAETSYEWISDSITTSIKYITNITQPYIIKDIIYPTTNDSIGNAIRLLQSNSLIKKGSQYDLDVLKSERIRIDDALKNNGFYYFNADYLIYKMDTAAGNRSIRIRMEIKSEAPASSILQYQIQYVNIFPEYILGKPNTAHQRIIDSINYFSDRDYIRPAPILQSVFLRSNQIYNRENHSLTLSRLNNLGVFKFVNVRIEKTDTAATSNNLLANVLLTPLPQKSLGTELQVASKSNNFIGPGLTLSYKNRNALGGAELFITNLMGSFEGQISGQYKGQMSYEISPSVELYVPRFILPFNFRSNSSYVPRTKFTFDISYLSRVNYYDIHSAKFTYGYKWKQNITTDHDLSLISINYFNIFNESADFKQLLAENPNLALRYEKQFIAGITYSYLYNQQSIPQKQNPLYFNLKFDVAGNTISAINSMNGNPPSTSNPQEVFGVKYSQYVKTDFDLRKLFKLDKNNKSFIATRLFAGWGYPYGNSTTMPFIKQYFSGGPYSLRGFPIYSVGPGTYIPPDSLQSLYFVQQGGEIKLEGNIEYRFTMTGMLKGAFFADAGNTWLNNENKDVPGGKFNPTTFYKEIAVSVGTGLRFDIQFFVFRLDLGIPVRKPWLPEDQRWVFNQMDITSSYWRKNNLVINIAFGYPF